MSQTAKSLKLINKKKSYKHSTEQVHTTVDETEISSPTREMTFGASSISSLFGFNFSDEDRQNAVTDYNISQLNDEQNENMQSLIQTMINGMQAGGGDVVESLNKNNIYSSNISNGNYIANTDISEENSTNNVGAWDPRLIRIDAFVSTAESREGNIIVPFASETASSAFFSELFSIEKGVIDMTKNVKSSNKTVSGTSTDEEFKFSDPKDSDKVTPNKTQVAELSADPDMYGTASLMNPYCVTRLVGGLTQVSAYDASNGKSASLRSNLYDIRDTKRFYDNVGEGRGGIIQTPDDMTSINNPTTTNIIAWSNKDKFGRTPYSFQDFVFCKWWNIIPNNRLITFRKYATPTYDNLNFPGMETEIDRSKQQKSSVQKTTAPIATAVTYFGGESANKLSDFLKFTTGTRWKDINADIHQVGGDTGSNPRAVVDSMFEKGGFGGVSSRSDIVSSFLGQTGGLTGKFLSFGKFLGLLDPQGFRGHGQTAWEKLTSANMDPQESLFSNRIIGPVNRVQSVKAREAGIEFSQSFSLTCEYVARPIGGVNTKAAMLDILANALELASPEAVFWGGGYRFMIHPHMYPFKRESISGSVMDALFAGKIFGTEGAIARGFAGLREFGTKGKDGKTTSFEWSNVTGNLAEILSQTLGGIGNMLQSVSSTLFGESSKLTSWIKSGTDAVSSEEAQAKGTAKLTSMLSNLNKMWKDQVIQETTMPNISGMKSILTGEPTGNWHLTLGNPLNPIMVVGNLICTKMDVQFDDELGPDDFPLSMKVIYTIEHAMARDKAGIQSMFNRGAGKIYKLPDYIKATSDYETKVDNFTGRMEPYMHPQYMHATKLMALNGAKGYQTYKISNAKNLQNTGNADTVLIPKFSPIDRQAAYQTVNSKYYNGFLSDDNVRSIIRGNLFTRKRSNN